MPICTVTNLEKTFGQRVMFDQLNFGIDRGERVGLIGDNGTGKTTLFKAIMGELAPDSGSVAIAKSVKVGYLTQSPTFDHDNTVIDEAELAFAQLHDLSHRMRDLEHEMAHVEGDALDRVLAKYQDAQHEFDLAGGYAWRHRLEATLLGVGLPENTWEQKVGTLSGGQKSRLALARLLISEPDLLLLDEPTNHLDLAAVSWLEKYLLEFNGAVLIISHDRYLLDRLATRIVWLTGAKLKSYPGNYSAFVQQRELQELSQQRAYEQQQADIAKQQEFVRRFGAGQRAREAKGREKRLNRLLTSDQMIQAVGVNHHIHLSLNSDQRAGDRVLKVTELSKSYGELALWKQIGFDVDRGERIGIIGPNGSGKTTLLEVLLARKDADEGDIRWGANLSIAYYDQQLKDFDPDNTVMEEARGDRDVKDQELRGVLALMLFRGTDIEKRVAMLSGGERARVAMAQLLLDKPNVMILDEPTNHLDIPSCEALENALQQFPGTILCVSHDRFFLDRTVSRLLVLDPPNMTDFEGNYSAWATKQASAASEAKAEKQGKKPAAQAKPAESKPTKKESPAQKTPPPKKDNPWARPFGRLTVSDLERQIVETETAVADAQQAMSARTADAGRIKKLKADYEAMAKKLEQLEAEYFLRGEK